MNKEKAVHYAFLIVAIFYGLMMLNSGVNKFLGYMPHPPLESGARALINAFTAAGYMWPIIALVEIVGGILVLTKRFRVVGALLLMPIAFNVFLLDVFLNRSMILIGIGVLSMNLLVLLSQKNKLAGLLNAEA